MSILQTFSFRIRLPFIYSHYSELQLEQARTYEERRLIRGQLRIAKKNSTTTSSTTTTSSSYKRFTDTTSQSSSPASSRPTKRDDTKTAQEEKPKDSSLGESPHKPLSKCKYDKEKNQ